MMGMNSIWHWLIVLLVVVLLFGAGRISGVMGDLGRGIKSFKKGLNEDDEPRPATVPSRSRASARSGGRPAHDLGDAVGRSRQALTLHARQFPRGARRCAPRMTVRQLR
jgi:sec-independent protein translocase protein TatA